MGGVVGRRRMGHRPPPNIEPPLLDGEVATWWVRDAITEASGGTPFVDSWPDRVRRLVTTSLADGNRPIFTNDIGGAPSADYDSSNQYRSYVANTVSTATQGTVAMVFLSDSVTATISLWGSADEASTTRLITGGILSSARIYIQQRNNDTDTVVSTTTTTLVAGTRYLVEWSSDGAAWTMRINGVLQSLSVDAGTNNGDWFGDTSARDNFTLASLTRTSTVNYYNGKIGYVTVCDTPFTDPTRQSLYRWVKMVYGIECALT